MATIEIDKTILEQTKIMVPAYCDIEYFIQKQARLYNALQSYRGSAKSEIDESTQAQLNQICRLVEGYQILVDDLRNIVESFLEFDDKIKAFNNELIESLSADFKRSIGR